jgi:hypothetical protein
MSMSVSNQLILRPKVADLASGGKSFGKPDAWHSADRAPYFETNTPAPIATIAS